MAAVGVPITCPDEDGLGTSGDSALLSDGQIDSAKPTDNTHTSELVNPSPCGRQGTSETVGSVTGRTAKPCKASTGGINVKDVMKNPALARMLVTAANKVKAERQQQLHIPS